MYKFFLEKKKLYIRSLSKVINKKAGTNKINDLFAPVSSGSIKGIAGCVNAFSGLFSGLAIGL
jgi:hypothetical protein